MTLIVIPELYSEEPGSEKALRRPTRQLQVADIYGFIHENLTKFAQLNLNSTMIFYGAKDAGKSTFLFQTSFFNMLTD